MFSSISGYPTRPLSNPSTRRNNVVQETPQTDTSSISAEPPVHFGARSVAQRTVLGLGGSLLALSLAGSAPSPVSHHSNTHHKQQERWATGITPVNSPTQLDKLLVSLNPVSSEEVAEILQMAKKDTVVLGKTGTGEIVTFSLSDANDYAQKDNDKFTLQTFKKNELYGYYDFGREIPYQNSQGFLFDKKHKVFILILKDKTDQGSGQVMVIGNNLIVTGPEKAIHDKASYANLLRQIQIGAKENADSSGRIDPDQYAAATNDYTVRWIDASSKNKPVQVAVPGSAQPASLPSADPFLLFNAQTPSKKGIIVSKDQNKLKDILPNGKSNTFFAESEYGGDEPWTLLKTAGNVSAITTNNNPLYVAFTPSQLLLEPESIIN